MNGWKDGGEGLGFEEEHRTSKTRIVRMMEAGEASGMEGCDGGL